MPVWDLPLLPGNFNNDGSVDGADLAHWQRDFGANRASDADADGDSDGDDFLIWQRSADLADGDPTAQLAEPTSTTLFAISPIACQRRIYRARARCRA